MTIRRLPGQFRVYQDVPIHEAIARYTERLGVLPDMVAVNSTYRLTDDEARALRMADAQLVMLPMIHGVWAGPIIK